MTSSTIHALVAAAALTLATQAKAQPIPAQTPTYGTGKPDPLEIVAMGSFHIGGRIVHISGKPVRDVLFSSSGVPIKLDPNGPYVVEQMYVQYFVPKSRRAALPILFWHGGGLTGVSYETTPDGREGWLNYFIRKGWTVYNSDAVERGRSGFAPPDVWREEATHLPMSNAYQRFRIGGGEGTWNPEPSKRKRLPGNQFPTEAYDDFAKQIVPRWTTTNAAIIAAYTDLVDKVCPCVILVHSQAGEFGQTIAQARPDKVKALVMLEPAAPGDIDNALKSVPLLAIYGDYIESDARWPKIRQNELTFLAKVTAAGGRVDIIDLPDVGINGNSHMIMMDKNNLAVADVILKWLGQRGVWSIAEGAPRDPAKSR
jgi:pimeloyl-ACP methyl ester carboxylesterase